MRFGYFDDKSREYVITTPKTPYPWINYLGSENFFALVSHRAGGYCFYRDARLRRLMRYRYNNVPTDVGGRYFYINDGGDVWNPSFAPTKTALDAFECRHGLGYTRITGERKGVRASLLMLVPTGHTAEVHELRIKNTGQHPQEPEGLLVHRVVPLERLRRHDQLPAQLQHRRGRGRGGGSTIYHKTEYRERRDHFAFYHVNAQVAGFDTDRETLLRPLQRLERAAGGAQGRLGDSVASGWAPIASHGLDVELAPGEEKTFVFTLGYVENPRDEKWEKPGVINKTRAHELIAQVLAAGAGGGRDAGARRPLVEVALELRHRVVRREAEPDGQHLEPLPVHGHLQHVAQRLVLRDGDWAWHGLPRLEPGSAGLRAPGARSARASGSSTSPRPSSPTAAPTTSTSRSPSAATTTSAAGSTTIRSG